MGLVPTDTSSDAERPEQDSRASGTRAEGGVFRFVVLLFIVSFVAQAVMFAFLVPRGYPPDEDVHLETVKLFSRGLFVDPDPTGIPPSITKLAPRSPWAYYWLAGKATRLDPFGIPVHLLLRLINVAFGLVFVIHGYLAIRTMSDSRPVRLLGLALLTNTIMLTYLSASVTYDMLTNAACAGAIYHTLSYWKRGRARSLLAGVAWILLGTLTKTTALPLALGLAICLVVQPMSKFPARLREAGREIRSSGTGTRLLAGIVLLLLAFNLSLYVPNLIRYRWPVPRPNQVLTRAEMLTSPTYARNSIVRDYDRGKITMKEAVREALGLHDPVGTPQTMGLLELRARRAEGGATFEPLSRSAYAVRWSGWVFVTSFGVLAYDSYNVPFVSLLPILALFGFAAVSFMVQAMRKNVPREHILLFGMAMFYVFFLMQVVNYRGYVALQYLPATIHGRYLFPVMVPLYGLAAVYAAGLPRPRIAWAIAIGATLYLVPCDLLTLAHYVLP